MPDDDAQLTADSLVKADLHGVESHGTVRVPIYAERLRRGAIAARPKVAIVRQTRCTAVMDDGNGMGQVMGQRAIALAIERAEAEGEPAWVSFSNSNHFGAASWFAEMAARRAMIGFAYTIGGINHMLPWAAPSRCSATTPSPSPSPPRRMNRPACSTWRVRSRRVARSSSPPRRASRPDRH